MTAQRLVENCVLTNQTAVVDEMLDKNLLPEEYIYPFVGDVMEWWLIDSWLARTTETGGRGYYRGIRLLLVGKISQRTGYLYGQRYTKDSSRITCGTLYILGWLVS